MVTPTPERPPLSEQLSGAEFRRWYWTMAELQPFARSIGVRAAGPKPVLADRLAAHLDGVAYVEPVPVKRRKTEPLGVIDESTVIPDGQRSTREVRAFFVERVGPSFRFNGHMRTFLNEPNGATFGDAIAHWHETKGSELPPQSSSLEFNRFTKRWHLDHPDGSAADARAAWNRYRALPVDQRPAVRDA